MLLQIKIKLEELGFNINHFGLIGVFFLLIIGLTFTNEPLLLENLFKLKFLKAEDQKVIGFNPETLEFDPISVAGLDRFAKEKDRLSSLVDPNFSEGSVLGISTQAEESISQILSEKNLAKITVRKVKSSEDNVGLYIDQVKLIEDYYGLVLILSAVASKDEIAATQAMALNKNIISELKAMKVPESYVRYHRLKMMHYGVINNMLENIIKKNKAADRSAAGILFFEIYSAMDTELSSIAGVGK